MTITGVRGGDSQSGMRNVILKVVGEVDTHSGRRKIILTLVGEMILTVVWGR